MDELTQTFFEIIVKANFDQEIIKIEDIETPFLFGNIDGIPLMVSVFLIHLADERICYGTMSFYKEKSYRICKTHPPSKEIAAAAQGYYTIKNYSTSGKDPEFLLKWAEEHSLPKEFRDL